MFFSLLVNCNSTRKVDIHNFTILILKMECKKMMLMNTLDSFNEKQTNDCVSSSLRENKRIYTKYSEFRLLYLRKLFISWLTIWSSRWRSKWLSQGASNRCTPPYHIHGFVLITVIASKLYRDNKYLFSAECWEISEENSNFTIQSSFMKHAQDFGADWDWTFKSNKSS